MSHILVTGANGFVGGAVIAALAAHGHQVRGAVRTADRPSDAPDTVVVGDIDADTDWSSALAGIEIVIHLAGRVHVMHESGADPDAEYHRVNEDGTAGLALAMASANVGRLVFLSTVKVFGEASTGTPFTEESAPAPEDGYARSKWAAEQAIARISAESALESVILRTPVVYGPGVRANFRALLRLCRSRVPLPFAAVKDNSRSMIFLGNLADALVLAATSPAAAGKTFIVAEGPGRSTADLMRGIRGCLGRRANLFPLPQAGLRLIGILTGRSGEIRRLLESFAVDGSLFQKTLGWVPPVAPEQALCQTLKG